MSDKPLPVVYMMLGLPGSGKTTFSKELASRLKTPRLSLDEEYFKKVGNSNQEGRDYEIEKMIADDMKDRVAQFLAEGKSVVLDYCPWKSTEREEYRDFIHSNNATEKIYYFNVPKKELLSRLKDRNNESNPHRQFMSEDTLDYIIANRFEPPIRSERVETVDNAFVKATAT